MQLEAKLKESIMEIQLHLGLDSINRNQKKISHPMDLEAHRDKAFETLEIQGPVTINIKD